MQKHDSSEAERHRCWPMLQNQTGTESYPSILSLTVSHRHDESHQHFSVSSPSPAGEDWASFARQPFVH
eukprot:1675699-Rhodomonas_salina.3